WGMLANGVFRLGLAAFFVLVLGGNAAGMMAGVLLGILAASAIGIWQTRSLWLAAPLAFDWRGLLRQVLPLMFGFGAFQFLFTADTMFVKTYFSAEATG